MSDILEYKCPACGAPVKYDSDKDKMSCDFCGLDFSLEVLQKNDENFHKEPNDINFDWQKDKLPEELDENLTGMICSSCGAQIIGDENTVANECPYCGNTNIIKKQISGMYKPDLIIPFTVKKQEAVAALKKHYNGKRLLPEAFIKDNRIESIQGLYVPFWLVDGRAEVKAVYDACRVARAWSDGDYDYIQTNYYELIRQGTYSFEKIPVDASSKMDDELMESIEPFNCQEAKEFTPAYLAGYLTDKYDVENTQCKERANERIENTALLTLENSAQGYTIRGVKSRDMHLEQGRINYALFPVWILTTRYKDKPYTFAMNGQTGKFIGDLPIDKSKLNKYMLASFFIAFVFFYLFFKFLFIASLTSA